MEEQSGQWVAIGGGVLPKAMNLHSRARMLAKPNKRKVCDQCGTVREKVQTTPIFLSRPDLFFRFQFIGAFLFAPAS